MRTSSSATSSDSLDDHETLVDAEQKCLGFDHAMLGAKVAESWRFSERVTAAIGYHHNSSDYRGKEILIVLRRSGEPDLHAEGILVRRTKAGFGIPACIECFVAHPRTPVGARPGCGRRTCQECRPIQLVAARGPKCSWKPLTTCWTLPRVAKVKRPDCRLPSRCCNLRRRASSCWHRPTARSSSPMISDRCSAGTHCQPGLRLGKTPGRVGYRTVAVKPPFDGRLRLALRLPKTANRGMLACLVESSSLIGETLDDTSIAAIVCSALACSALRYKAREAELSARVEQLMAGQDALRASLRQEPGRDDRRARTAFARAGGSAGPTRPGPETGVHRPACRRDRS